jgi:hypothetical protein
MMCIGRGVLVCKGVLLGLGMQQPQQRQQFALEAAILVDNSRHGSSSAVVEQQTAPALAPATFTVVFLLCRACVLRLMLELLLCRTVVITVTDCSAIALQHRLQTADVATMSTSKFQIVLSVPRRHSITVTVPAAVNWRVPARTGSFPRCDSHIVLDVLMLPAFCRANSAWHSLLSC